MNIQEELFGVITLTIDTNEKNLKRALTMAEMASTNKDPQKQMADMMENWLGRELHIMTDVQNNIFNHFIALVEWKNLADHYLQKFKEAKAYREAVQS